MSRVVLLASVLGLVSVFSAACDTDPCAELNCGEHAVCLDGACLCDANYSGTTCEIFTPQDQVASDFEDLSLAPESFDDGADAAGHFVSGLLDFTNTYNADYQSWDGFAMSNVTDSSTAGWGNQFAVIAGAGQGPSANFAVAYVPTYEGGSLPALSFVDQQPHTFAGAYLCNTTQAYLSMRDGDDYAKAFGGEDGSDPDWFLLQIYGRQADAQRSGPVDFYLADFRGAQASEDYLIDTWTWVDLSPLGAVTGLEFSLSSSDTGDYGMNTPAYFAIDTIMVRGDGE